MVIVTSGCFAYLVENISIMRKSTEASYVIAALSIYFLQYWVFVVQKERFHDFVEQLQHIIDASAIINPLISTWNYTVFLFVEGIWSSASQLYKETE